MHKKTPHCLKRRKEKTFSLIIQLSHHHVHIYPLSHTVARTDVCVCGGGGQDTHKAYHQHAHANEFAVFCSLVFCLSFHHMHTLLRTLSAALLLSFRILVRTKTDNKEEQRETEKTQAASPEKQLCSLFVQEGKKQHFPFQRHLMAVQITTAVCQDQQHMQGDVTRTLVLTLVGSSTKIICSARCSLLVVTSKLIVPASVTAHEMERSSSA